MTNIAYLFSEQLGSHGCESAHGLFPVEDSANSANVPALKSRYPELMSSFLILLLCIHTKYHNG